VTPGEHEIGVSYARRPLDSAAVEERYESELTRSATVLDGVDHALERLSKGSYGTCDTCADAIAAADLEGDPTRRHCAQHLEFTSPETN
jgi:RNA polymerase-binding transcription factor DksA